MNFIRKKLSPLAMPQEIEFTDKLPKTRSAARFSAATSGLRSGARTVGDLSTLEDD
jgi:acyl-coenzyme A synthetase/AMP-(fatty) acid ligase